MNTIQTFPQRPWPLLSLLSKSLSSKCRSSKCRSLASRSWTFLALTTLVLHAGCASRGPSMAEVVKDQSKAEAQRLKDQERAAQSRQERMEAFVLKVPQWALEAPKPDATGVYAVGMASSDNLGVSLRKAMLEAEFGLAKTFRQEISGTERSLVDDRLERVRTQQYQQVIDKLVARVPVVGHEVVRQEVRPVQGAYHAFVLLKLPYAPFNRVLQELRAEGVDAAAQAAYQDVERQVGRP